MADRDVKKTLLKSSRLSAPTLWQKLGLGLAGMLLCPVYWLLAKFRGAPGLHLRWKCFCLGLRLLFRRQAPIDPTTIFLLLLFPLDASRYFELNFFWEALTKRSFKSYLDVSSPRQAFTLLLLERPDLTADLINPDTADIEDTRKPLNAAGLLSRCRLQNKVIAGTAFAAGSFDVITSVSVVEHIPEDRQAIQKMWDLLKPGGMLLLTVPCARETSDQYIDRNEYGVLESSAEGHVFWQRFYDVQLLEERIFSVTGKPHKSAIFGERQAGFFQRNAEEKRSNRYYPFWQEPYLVAQEYTYFASLEELPGEGVFAMEFIKP